MTFAGVNAEAAILTDSEEGQQQIQITEDDDQNDDAVLKLPEEKRSAKTQQKKQKSSTTASKQPAVSPLNSKNRQTALASRHAKAGDANRKAVIEHYMEDRAPEI